MSNGNKGTLQSHLTKEEFVRVADVRRSLWTAGFKGMGVGIFAGAASYPAWKLLHKLGHVGLKPEPRHATMARRNSGVKVTNQSKIKWNRMTMTISTLDSKRVDVLFRKHDVDR